MAETILPSQMRAARALIDWSQDDLARASSVSLSNIKDFESGRRDIAAPHAASLRKTLVGAGVQFIFLTEAGGPGVRLEAQIPKILKRPSGVDFYDQMVFRIEWRGEEVFVILPKTVIEDLDRANYNKDSEFLASFKEHEDLILESTARALYAGRLDQRSRLHLRPGDFPLP